jgi:hypothetical protein
MTAAGRVEQFVFSPNDPFAPEHQAVMRWVHEATQSPKGNQYWSDVDLKTLESGRALLEAKPEQARKIVLAALVQTKYWDSCLEQIRAKTTSDIERANLHRNPAWMELQISRQHTIGVIAALIRRSLPFEHSDVVDLLKWAVGTIVYGRVPGGYIVKALQRYAATNPLDPELITLAQAYGEKLRGSYDKQEKRWGTELEQLTRKTQPEVFSAQIPQASRPAPEPAPAGNPLVLHNLKSMLGVASPDQLVPTTQIGPDRFDMPAGSPLMEHHERLSALLSEAAASQKYGRDMNQFPAGQAILRFEPARRARILLAAAERHIGVLFC